MAHRLRPELGHQGSLQFFCCAEGQTRSHWGEAAAAQEAGTAASHQIYNLVLQKVGRKLVHVRCVMKKGVKQPCDSNAPHVCLPQARICAASPLLGEGPMAGA